MEKRPAMNKFRIWARWGLARGKRSRFIIEGLDEKLLQALSLIIPSLLFISFGIIIYEFGFKTFRDNHDQIDFWLRVLLGLSTIGIGIRWMIQIFTSLKWWVRTLNIVGWFFLVFLVLYVLPEKASIENTDTNKFLFLKLILYAGIVLAFITEISYFIQIIYSKTVNPGLLFIGSFAFLVLFGAFLLKLPNATHSNISNIDAVFTSTSAICVTGLQVVDIAQFTPFGQVVILVLIQIGGLGFMTFAGLLAYTLAGDASFKAQLAYKDLMSSNQFKNIMHFIVQVIFITLLFEAIGAAFIYFSVDDHLFRRQLDKLFFAVFHAVSAFCNAGFSTFSKGLYEPVLRFNYSLHLTISVLIIFGGLGFPIVFNLYRYVRVKVQNLVHRLRGDIKREHFPGLSFLNSRLALHVSGVLLLLGFIAYFVFEQSASLADHPSLEGKIVTSIFGSVTPRTAGFNSVDLSTLSLPTIMIYLMLMWIGASPGSTGGGIKTTTAGVAILNMVSILRGRDRTEYRRSEISSQSIQRAFAIIVLSLILIGTAIFLLSLYDSEKGLLVLAFEAFSAFSTVGLTLGITTELSGFGKMVLVFTMFIGRVGMITLLVLFIKQSRRLYYRYPKEDITF